MGLGPTLPAFTVNALVPSNSDAGCGAFLGALCWWTAFCVMSSGSDWYGDWEAQPLCQGVWSGGRFPICVFHAAWRPTVPVQEGFGQANVEDFTLYLVSVSAVTVFLLHFL